MRVLVCGGRDYNDTEYLTKVLNSLKKKVIIDCLIEGDAKGADRMAGYWARKNQITNLKFPADWNEHGKKAGYIRNKQMLNEGKPDIVIAFPGGRGTEMMKRLSKEAGVKVYEV